MMVRSAFWVGKPRSGSEQAFRKAIDEELVPEMRKFPGVARANALWPVNREDEPPGIHCQIILEFASADDLARMKSSPERTALRPRVMEMVGMFEGILSHIDYEARDL